MNITHDVKGDDINAMQKQLVEAWKMHGINEVTPALILALMSLCVFYSKKFDVPRDDFFQNMAETWNSIDLENKENIKWIVIH